MSASTGGGVTAADVVAWVREAGTGPHRRRKVTLSESDSEVKRVARLVEELRKHYRRDRSQENYAPIAGGREVQRLVRELRKALPPLLEAIEKSGTHYRGPEGWRPEPLWEAISELHDAVEKTAAVIGDPPRKGPPRELWVTWADALVDPIRHLLVKAFGRERVSTTNPDGPLVRVMCCALAAIDDSEHDPVKVSSGLDRLTEARRNAT